jgi:hypothetical protein
LLTAVYADPTNLDPTANHPAGCGCGCGCGCSAATSADASLVSTDNSVAGLTARLSAASAARPAYDQPSIANTNPYAGITFPKANLGGSLFQSATTIQRTNPAASLAIRPTKFLPITVDTISLQSTLSAAKPNFTSDLYQQPTTSLSAVTAPTTIDLPTPDGSLRSYYIWENGTMDAELAAKFPDIHTYTLQGVDDRSAVGSLEYTPLGLSAHVLSSSGSFYIDPIFHLDQSVYMSYWRTDLHQTESWRCGGVLDQEATDLARAEQAAAQSLEIQPTIALLGDTLRTYDLAVSTTGEYTAFHGGTVAGGLSAVVTIVNRLNTIYIRDLAVQLQLVANNNLLINTSAATDPFTAPAADDVTLNANQTTVDTLIGSANYDVGHVFHRGGGGGVAGAIGNVAVNGQKAKGFSSRSTITGDAFTIDYVAHELGHQFAGRHTFNNCSGSQGDSSTLAVEPTSGSTIMAYAGICSSNLQTASDAMFHSINIEQIRSYITTTTVNNAATRTSTGNSIPTLTGGSDFTIPDQTPFLLTATASDANNDSLTYSWEQRNGGAAISAGTSSSTTGPLFRTLLPTSSPVRSFPRLSSVLSGIQGSTATGEILPTVARTLNFTVLARDNRAGGGGTANDQVVITVVNSGTGFAITNFNSTSTVAGGSAQTITWNVSGTDANGINATSVIIELSTDGGNNWQHTLAASTANDGTETVNLPFNVGSTTARLRVRPVGNIFYDINNANLTLTNVPTPASTTPAAPDLLSVADTGPSTTDNITRRNNATPADVLTFTINNTVAGASLELLLGTTVIGNAIAEAGSTIVSSNGSLALADGTYAVTIRQTESGKLASTSAAGSVTIDTVAPTLTVPANQTRTSLTSSGTLVFLPTPTVTDANPGSVVSSPGSGIFALGQYSISVTATDLAGNASAGSYDLNVIPPSFLTTTTGTFDPGTAYSLSGFGTGQTLSLSGPSLRITQNPASVGYPSLQLTATGSALVQVEAPLSLASLNINAGSTVNFLPGLGSLQLTALTLAGTLNLRDNDLLLDYTGASPIADLISSYTSGLLQSDSAASSLPTYLAITEAADLGLATFGGIEIDDTTLIAKYTYTGDANLDGQVDALDYERVDLAIGNSGVLGTAQGDLNYDGVVDALDYEQVDLNVGNGVGSPLAVNAAPPLATTAPNKTAHPPTPPSDAHALTPSLFSASRITPASAFLDSNNLLQRAASLSILR